MKTVLIDGNNQAHIHNNIGRLSVGSLQTQAIFGYTKAIRNIRNAHFDCRLINLWDGRAQWRFDMHPNYKSNRDADPKAVVKKQELVLQRPYIEQMLKSLGIPQMLVATHEADDMAGYLVMNSGEPFELITGDRDWLQLVRENVTWYDPVREVRVTHANFLEMTGYYTPQEFLQGKCLMGDSSDVISGVGGIGEKGAPLFMAEHRNVAEFFRKVESGEYEPKGKVLKAFATKEGKIAFARNYKLMSLREVPKPRPNDVSIIRGEYNEEDFLALCRELNFTSIIRDKDAFLKPFRDVQT